MRTGMAAAGWPRRLLLLLLLLFNSAANGAGLSCMGDGSNGMGTTYPSHDLNLEPGTEFNLTCQIDPSHANVKGYTARDLYFTRSQLWQPRVEVSPQLYEVVNSTTLRVTDRLETRGKYAYACRLRHKNTPTMGICTNNVNIGDPPQPVEGFRCVSQNWLAVNCSWQEPVNAVHTRYQAEYRLMLNRVRYRKPCNGSKVRRSLRPDQMRRVFCLVSENDFRFSHETFRMVVHAENALGNSSWSFSLNTYEIVRPAAPVHVRANGITTSSVRLQAEIGHPMASFPKPIDFGVEYTSRWNATPQAVDASAMVFRHSSKHVKGRSTTNETLVTGLLPNTEYRFAVRMRSSVADVQRHPDLWSPPLEKVVRTPPTVPAASPRTTLGSFQLVALATSRSVYVYWRQIAAQQENGAEFGYCAQLRRPDGSVAAVTANRTTAAYALFTGLDLGGQRFTVTSCNVVGDSVQPASLLVPAQRDVVPRPHSVLLLTEAPGNYTLAWEQKAGTPVDNYTLFWCQHTRDRPYQCEGQLDWTVVAGRRRNHSLQLPPSAEYQFAVAANHGGASSGMVWSPCVLLANGERTEQLDSVYVQDVQSTELTLSWRDHCSSLETAGLSYKVYYCVSHDGRCLPGPAGEERSMEQRAAGSRGRPPAVAVAGLSPFTEYRLQVSVLSGPVEGQRSQPVVNRTRAGPPEPPVITQVMAVSAGSLQVVWAPAKANGRMVRYELQRLDSAGRMVQLSTNASILTATVTGLQPYTEYTFQLLACNRHYCSPPSQQRSGHTLPGRPGGMEPPRTQLLNTSAVRLIWWPPEIAGGPQPRYTLLTVSEREQVNTTTSRPLNGTATPGGRLVAEVRVPECQPGSSQRHLFAVRAAVTLDSGDEAAGPWSELAEQPCVLVSDWPTATIAGVVVGGALLMMCVVLLFFVLCHRTKRKLSEMRNLGVNMPAGLDRAEKTHGFPGGPEAGYGRLVSQSSAGGTDRTTASVSGQPLLQEELNRDECDGEGSGGELTPAVHTDSNSCASSGATNYTSDSGAECEKGASSPTCQFQWPSPVESPRPQLSPYVQAGGLETAGAGAATAGSAPPYTKFSPYVDAKAIQALVTRGRSMESLPSGEPAAELSRSEPELGGSGAGPPPAYSQVGHRSSAGYVSMTSEDALPAVARPFTRLGSPSPPAAGCAKSPPPPPAAATKTAELKPYVSLGPPPPPASAAGFPPYVLAGPPPGEGPAKAGAGPSWSSPRPAEARPVAAAPPVASAGYVQHDKLQPQMELRQLPVSVSDGGPAGAGYVPQEALAAGEPVLSPKKLPTVATARDPYCRVVTSYQSPPDLGPNVSMV